MNETVETKPVKKYRSPDNFMLSPEIRKSLNEASEKTGAPKSEIVRRALRKYLGMV
jgi:predicted DNA-binding protein